MKDAFSEDVRLFSSAMKIHYDRRFLNTAQEYVESLAKLSGASEKEAMQLVLLIEECLVFLIDKYIDCRLDAHIEICFSLCSDNNIVLELNDVGPPIHESRIPSFDVNDEASESGLWYKLVKGVADDFTFVNYYGEGWKIRFCKRIENLSFEADIVTGDPELLNDNVDGSAQKSTRLATVEDIPQLIDLAYLTYRYSYDVEFCHTDILQRCIEEGVFEITVVCIGDKIIGAYIVKHPGDGCAWAEVGSAMILPQFRNGRTSLLLMRALNQCVKDNLREREFFVSHAVTSHVRSQKFLYKIHNGFQPLFLFLNMVPQPQFIGIEEETGGRESLICSFHLNEPLQITSVFTTPIHHQIVAKLVASLDVEVDIQQQFANEQDAVFQMQTQVFGEAGFSIINIATFGKDWFVLLSNKIIELLSSGVETINVNIPTSGPMPPDLDAKLDQLNLSFCGLNLLSVSKLSMAYCLTTKPVDFSNIVLHGDLANELLEHIQKHYRGRSVSSQTHSVVDSC